MVTAHSVIGQLPTGVHLSRFEFIDNKPKFGFKPNLTEAWEKLYEEERLEFRRLKVLED